jgi:curved DNA-binding protein CbpA
MAAADDGGPDLYQLLEELAQAWRRQARAEHPDARPADAAAPGRFRALAEAWQVLGDPARRAAYDRAPAGQLQSASRVPAARIRVPVRRVADPGGMTPLARLPEPPLRAGPVRVEGPRQAPRAGGWDEEDITLAVLALRYLVRDRGRPW